MPPAPTGSFRLVVELLFSIAFAGMCAVATYGYLSTQALATP